MDALLAAFSDWRHLALLGGATVGGVLIGVGILKESEKWTGAAILILIGVVIEPIFTLWLFVYDENIGRAQQDKIIALESTIEGFLQPRKLTQQQKDRIVSAIKPFPPVSFDAEFAPGEEPWEFVVDISVILRDAGWHWEAYPRDRGNMVWWSIDRSLPPEGMTMAKQIVLIAPPALHDLAEALAKALTDPNVIGMEKVAVLSDPSQARITIVAGSKR